ncbi:hypothetical protein [Streptomyces sp. NPDC050388]
MACHGAGPDTLHDIALRTMLGEGLTEALAELPGREPPGER